MAVTFKTETSGFDTRCCPRIIHHERRHHVCRVARSGAGGRFEGLDHESAVDFGVRAGEQYARSRWTATGAVGTVDFQWEFRTLANEPPQILNTWRIAP